ncbi:Dihydroorotase [Arcticibacter svalbardensis MN12-7]|uniref:Dihydroorotase n=1 Tax=Arcticibacter svalbardensis MN12-7 TaxID=1150600 RepID=R9H4W3_9SPHI|nr:dihydroorotase [Arcticibacter svalbardensis]EOR96194.1 Dihydroorotase [Arcticibacter svalbardensis MN12-7]
MNKLLFRSATLIHPESKFHNQVVDLLILDGKIEDIAQTIDVNGDDLEIINAEGCFISTGFFDLNANFGEPGNETCEDLISGTQTAVAGGFTGIALQPATEPPVHSKAGVSYILNRTSSYLTDVYPLGCISYNRAGKDLAELYDMKLAGAIAFTDGTSPINDSGLMSRALLYVKGFGGLIFSYPEDTSIAGKGKMNEGIVSTYLGMKGIPNLAEEVSISRDLYLAEYNESKIHFSTISCAGSVELIRKAKEKGIQVTCDVAVHHLVLTDEALSGFDTQYKVRPPLRTQNDVDALIAGLKDGTIDAIVSQHTPHEIEFKDVEFEIASFGIIGLQTALPLALKAGLSPALIVEKMAINPRQILHLPIPGFEKGDEVNLVLFNPEEEWTFEASTNKSKSANSPFINHKLKGKVLAVCNKKQFYYQQ